MRSFSKTFDSSFSLGALKKINGYRKIIDAVQ
jgi:hypothetical protein